MTFGMGQSVRQWGTLISSLIATIQELRSVPSHSPPHPRSLHSSSRSHPFPFLQRLEWGLLAIAGLGELLPLSIPALDSRYPLLTILCLIGLGLMGWRLPQGKLSDKVAYTVLEIGLVLVATAIGIRGLRLFPFLYVIVVIRSCLMFGWSGRLWIAGGSFCLFLLMLSRRIHGLGNGPPLPEAMLTRRLVIGFALNAALLLGLSLIFVLLLVNALLAERRSREQLAEANSQLRRYALRVEELAMTQERSRIARDIHDSLGHSLTALNLQLEGALKLWERHPAQARQFLGEAKQLGSTALQDVRRSVAALRSDPLAGKTFVTAIQDLVNDFQRTTGIAHRLQIDLGDRSDCESVASRNQTLNASSSSHQRDIVSEESKIAVYRVIQEALTNSYKHAKASQVTIQIAIAASSVLTVCITDNGIGFVPDHNTSGFGLQGMRERCLALNGDFQVTSTPTQGCQIVARLPLPGPRENQP